jgi:hypothetical protein
MSEELWVGVALKLEHAFFHFNRMSECLRPKHDARSAVLESTGAIVDHQWQRSFYAHLDAFLSATKSVPEIIKCCFGTDRHPDLRAWWGRLSPDEQRRRDDFTQQFKTHHQAFRDLPLSKARNISEHRVGYPDVTVTINGMFGVTHVGSPTKLIPLTETRTDLPANMAWMAKPRRIDPMWTDFTIDGQPLFEVCRDYLNAASALMNTARGIVQSVHGDHPLTPPE